MTRDEFISLPLRVALGVLYDAMPKRLGELPAPELPRSPKYDGRIPKGEKSFVWMSEMDLPSLVWWEKKKTEAAEKGDRFAEQNRKGAITLAKWIEWRRCFPRSPWEGTRGEERVTAQPPSKNPEQHPWQDKPRKEEDDDQW